MAKKKSGHQLRHPEARNQCYLVPLLGKPLPTPPGQPVKICPTCRVHHPVKVLHLWLGPAGECLVSDGVLTELKAAGMAGFVLAGHTDDPPPLVIGDGRSRAAMDHDNRAQVIYSAATLGALHG